MQAYNFFLNVDVMKNSGCTCDMGPHLALVQGDEIAETALVLAPVPLVHGVIARPAAAG